MPLLRAIGFLALRTAFLVPPSLLALQPQEVHRTAVSAPTANVAWRSESAEHAYGLPDTKPGRKGILSIDAQNVTFTSKISNTAIERTSITAVSSGNDRVELWGTGGRLMRMAIPNGGGLAAAAFMHHRVDMLTIEFRDARGGMHSAVFYLPAKEGDEALKHFQKESLSPQPVPVTSCPGAPVDPRSVVVALPVWDKADVPSAYRSLVYEHVVDRLKAAKGVGHVYRYGELSQGSSCPQYTIQIAVQAYKKGNQVVRAATGPIGMFTSATQMIFSVTYTDASGALNKSEALKAAVRTESESTGVADSVARKLAKQYSKLLETSAREAAASPGTPAS